MAAGAGREVPLVDEGDAPAACCCVKCNAGPGDAAADGGEPNRITFNGTYNTTASFASDGRSIVMLHKENGMYFIALQDLDTDHLDILTKNGRDQSPSLAPNDDMILFATRNGPRQVLGMVSVDGRVRLRLPAMEGDVREPAWSPRAI